MEEIFKGLVERAHYYEQFESFRTKDISWQLEDTSRTDLKMKVSVMSM